ncbi:MAG TPA: HNH endonuclease [Methanoregulaceae archaeon]|nr:HNH endonuclease [Methanoregulaceae archaeon]
MKQEDRPIKWGGRTWYPCVGYYSNDHTFLQRAIYEAAHGSIPDGCVIHHIDGNPENNEIANLEALSPSKHRLLHEKQTRERLGAVDITAVRTEARQHEHICKHCGKVFFTSRKGEKGAAYCTPRCRTDAYRAAHRPAITRPDRKI